jgi:hypothetical protein
LRQVGPFLDEDFCKTFDGGQVGSRIYESVELEVSIADSRSCEWYRISAADGGYAEAVVAQGAHRRNAKIVIFAPDIKEMGLRGIALLAGRFI